MSGGYILEISTNPTNAPILLGVSTDFSGLSSTGEISGSQRLNQTDLEKLNVVNNIIDTINGNSVACKITNIDITDSKNYTLRLDEEGKTVYLGDCKNINTRILYMKAILEKEKGKNGEIFINADLDSGYVYFKESE